jgi:hypothetical protein
MHDSATNFAFDPTSQRGGGYDRDLMRQ